MYEGTIANGTRCHERQRGPRSIQLPASSRGATIPIPEAWHAPGAITLSLALRPDDAVLRFYGSLQLNSTVLQRYIRLLDY
jgi:hypothetical protein